MTNETQKSINDLEYSNITIKKIFSTKRVYMTCYTLSLYRADYGSKFDEIQATCTNCGYLLCSIQLNYLGKKQWTSFLRKAKNRKCKGC